MKLSPERTDALLSALDEQLASRGERFELVVIGGSALIALELVARTATKDVDVVALRTESGLEPAQPLPPTLLAARDKVARDFEINEDWLNTGPADLLRWGLPDGFVDRLTPRRYGDHLAVHFAGRLDQIHFKLYAAADQQGGRHEDDLRALDPTQDELVLAARWTRTQDSSEGFLLMLRAKLADLGVVDADLGA
jgi:hypothetical protein